MTLEMNNSGKGLAPPIHAANGTTQAAALCYRVSDRGLEFLLINSSSGRWIPPKGWPINGLSLAKAAKQEAWEEAGVKKGKLHKRRLGKFKAVKHYNDGIAVPCDVHVFALKVKKLADDFPEASKRDRVWMSPAKAAKKVTEPGLQKIILKFSPRIKRSIADAA